MTPFRPFGTPRTPAAKPAQTKPLSPRREPTPTPLYTVRVTHAPGNTHRSKPLTHRAALALLDNAAGLYGDVMGSILYFDVDERQLPVGFLARDRADLTRVVAAVRIEEVGSAPTGASGE